MSRSPPVVVVFVGRITVVVQVCHRHKAVDVEVRHTRSLEQHRQVKTFPAGCGIDAIDDGRSGWVAYFCFVIRIDFAIRCSVGTSEVGIANVAGAQVTKLGDILTILGIDKAVFVLVVVSGKQSH